MSFEIDVTLRRGTRDISVELIASGGLIALFGPSGAGKTSVLNAVAGLLRPERGRVVVDGRVLFDHAEAIDLPPEQRACGYVFQEHRLFPHRTVRDNLLYGQRFAPAERRFLSLEDAASFLGIGGLLDRWPHTLSGGEAQRVAIGRALLAGPRFLLMDEPLASVDLDRRVEIIAVIERLRDEMKLPILYVSHDRAEVEQLATQVVDLA